MKKYLLPQGGQFYKANLHCHTTCSDGKLSPEAVKEAYKEKGYSIVAYTDHFLLVPHNELTDDSFLALNAVELDNGQEMHHKYKKTCHMCFIALEPDNVTQVCYHREKYVRGNMLQFRDKVKVDESVPDFEREYTSECVCEMMRIGREHGFFVTYNHPTWSMENYGDYSKYENMHAMEIYNHSGAVTGFAEYNPQVYDDLLRQDKRILCIATDDNHNSKPFDDPRCDSFGGFTMIKADKLEYKTITDALLAGNFYASQGPAIEKLWFEDGKLHVKSSAAEKITMTTGTRKVRSAFREKGKRLTEATFEVQLDDKYVRVTVTDKHGLHADTNAYFVDELFSE
ncbi:MAG: PHP domain-containing protein [Clostridia bacterium]|nr:PHP domain-containing protein [Clostridia bacterium]